MLLLFHLFSSYYLSIQMCFPCALYGIKIKNILIGWVKILRGLNILSYHFLWYCKVTWKNFELKALYFMSNWERNDESSQGSCIKNEGFLRICSRSRKKSLKGNSFLGSWLSIRINVVFMILLIFACFVLSKVQCRSILLLPWILKETVLEIL